jgi:hypothetical protein
MRELDPMIARERSADFRRRGRSGPAATRLTAKHSFEPVG